MTATSTADDMTASPTSGDMTGRPAPYPTDAEIHAFFTAQTAAWPEAAARFRALANVETRKLRVEGMTFTLQFNPARAVSTNAKTDAASIAARPCFLCAANRPTVQTGRHVGPGGRFELLLNPFPIFTEHFTVTDRTHRRQELDGEALRTLVEMAAAAPAYTFFYNGPHSGASAPDHLHLQCARDPYGAMSLPEAALTGRRLLRRIGPESDNATSHSTDPCAATVAVCPELPVRPFVIEGRDPAQVARLAEAMLAAIPALHGEWEPRVNVFGRTTRSGSLEVVIVGRDRHRPRQYDEGTVNNSPGAADIAGCLILTRREDFDSLTADTLADIIRQVRLADEPFSQAILNIISTPL